MRFGGWLGLSADRGLFEAADFFSDGEADEVVEGDTFVVGQIIGPLTHGGRKPQWEALKALVFEAHASFPFLSWDKWNVRWFFGTEDIA